MKPYCVTVVKYVLPAMRVLITKELMEKYGLRKIEVADRMSISPAAVTQYSKGVRGSHYVKKISGSEEIMKKISEISEAVANDEANLEAIMENMCEVCRLIRSKKKIGEPHAGKASGSELDEPTICVKNEA
jgi:predicted transcriptional regulator